MKGMMDVAENGGWAMRKGVAVSHTPCGGPSYWYEVQ